MDGTGSTEHVTSPQVTVAEAAVLLGVSVVTIRRMIRRGQLEAQRVHRPQGSAYVVMLPVDGTGDATPTEQPARNMSRPNGTPGDLMTVWSETFLSPIMARMAEQEGVIREQAETIGQLRERLATVDAAQHPQTGSGATEPAIPAPEASTLWRRWWPLVIMLVLALAVAAVLLMVR